MRRSPKRRTYKGVDARVYGMMNDDRDPMAGEMQTKDISTETSTRTRSVLGREAAHHAQIQGVKRTHIQAGLTDVEHELLTADEKPLQYDDDDVDMGEPQVDTAFMEMNDDDDALELVKGARPLQASMPTDTQHWYMLGDKIAGNGTKSLRDDLTEGRVKEQDSAGLADALFELRKWSKTNTGTDAHAIIGTTVPDSWRKTDPHTFVTLLRQLESMPTTVFDFRLTSIPRYPHGARKYLAGMTIPPLEDNLSSTVREMTRA